MQTDSVNILIDQRYIIVGIAERGRAVSFLGIHKLDFRYKPQRKRNEPKQHRISTSTKSFTVFSGCWKYLYIGYTHKKSGFKTSGFKTSETSGLQNVRFTKLQVYKMSGLQNVRSSKHLVEKKHPYIFCTCGWWKSAGSVAAMLAGVRSLSVSFFIEKEPHSS